MVVKRSIKKTHFYSYSIGTLAKGCQLCVKGEKLVMFVTGICPRHCSYCPVSDKKYQKDVTYADEWPTSNIDDIIKEAELCESKGAGFTGGDPLVKINRTVTLIGALKQRFGKAFHTHLYTSFDLVDEQKLKLLYDAGLDEIRFHADIDNDDLWLKIDIARKFDWDIGIEIPVIPGKKEKTQKLMRFFEGKIMFMNLNELEIADAKASRLSELGMQTKDKLSYGVKGSETLAKELLKFAEKNVSYSLHYCTAKLKDKVQLSKRIARRAQNVKQKFDILNKDGTLTRGVIYLPYLTPSFDYTEKLSKLTLKQRKFILGKLKLAKSHLMRENGVPADLLAVDEQRLRLLTNAGVVQNLGDQIKQMHLKPAIVTEYPTWDAMIVELEWI